MTIHFCGFNLVDFFSKLKSRKTLAGMHPIADSSGELNAPTFSKHGGTPPHHPKSDHFSIETNGLSGLPYFRKPPYFIEPRVCILPGWTWLIFLDLVDLVPSGGGIGAWQAFSAAPQHTTRSKYMCR